MNVKKKVFVFGIDGTPPKLLFERWIDELPNIKRLMDKGLYAELNSTVPPSTILAWTAFASGRDPGEMGIYSYTCKVCEGSDEVMLTNSTKKRKEMVWDLLGKTGKKSISLFVPLTYPVKKIDGCMASGFLTPGMIGKCAYPDSLKEKLKSMSNPDMFFDVAIGLAGHRGIGIDNLIKNTYEMTDMQIKLVKDLVANEEWDFFMAVMIGTDRLQHSIWKHFDEEHRFFIKDSQYKDVLKDYYKYLDKRLGEILDMLDDDTVVVVSSDHGMVRQEGKINVNDFLVKEGYLFFKDDFLAKAKLRWKEERKFTKFKLTDIDWSKTKAYEVGAYQARIYINRKSRGPDGIVSDEEFESVREEIANKLLAITDDKGRKLDTKVFRPEDIYKNGFDDECPDMIVFFDNLAWGVNNDGVGSDQLYLVGEEAGNDNAGHHPVGSFIMSGSGVEPRGKIDPISIMDVTPTILKIFDMEIPSDMQGKAIKYD